MSAQGRPAARAEHRAAPRGSGPPASAGAPHASGLCQSWRRPCPPRAAVRARGAPGNGLAGDAPAPVEGHVCHIEDAFPSSLPFPGQCTALWSCPIFLPHKICPSLLPPRFAGPSVVQALMLGVTRSPAISPPQVPVTFPVPFHTQRGAG